MAKISETSAITCVTDSPSSITKGEKYRSAIHIPEESLKIMLSSIS